MVTFYTNVQRPLMCIQKEKKNTFVFQNINWTPPLEDFFFFEEMLVYSNETLELQIFLSARSLYLNCIILTPTWLLGDTSLQ